MFGRSISMFLGTLVFSAAAPAYDTPKIICIERVGGWCEEDGRCYENTLKPAEFRISTSLIPRGSQQAQGQLQECREGKCGSSWSAALKSNSMNDVFVSYGDTEIFQIHRTSGFFTRTTLTSGEALGRVSHTFGRCVISG